LAEKPTLNSTLKAFKVNGCAKSPTVSCKRKGRNGSESVSCPPSSWNQLNESLQAKGMVK
jgi:hypothetical protein